MPVNNPIFRLLLSSWMEPYSQVLHLTHRFRKTLYPQNYDVAAQISQFPAFNHDLESDLADEFKRQPVDRDDSLFYV